jgi:hypothetical protein
MLAETVSKSRCGLIYNCMGFPPVYNNVATFLRSPHAIGDGVIHVQAGTGQEFGTVFPLRITCQRVSDSAIVIFQVTARTGDDLTVSQAIEGTTDIALISGDICQQRLTALAVTEIQDSLTYTSTSPVTSTVGGVDAGTSITNVLTRDVVDQLLHSPTNLAITTGAEAHGISCVACGQASLAFGHTCIAMADGCSAQGIQCQAGPAFSATISGTLVTISGDYQASFTTNVLDLVLAALADYTGAYVTPLAVLATITNIAYDGTNTLLTLATPLSTTPDATQGWVASRTQVTGAHAEGNSIASGLYSHSEGSSTARGQYAHAEGSSNGNGDNSHSEGAYTTAGGTSSHAEGNNTNATGDSSHAEGGNNTASGPNSHAEGTSTTSSGSASHAEGASTTASANFSHSQGESTSASGPASHAEGRYTNATGQSSHAGGYRAVADNKTQFARSDGGFLFAGFERGQYCFISESAISQGTTPGILQIGGGASDTTNGYLVVPDGSTFFFEVRIAAKSANSKVAWFARQGIIQTVGGVTSLVGSVTTIGTDNNTPGWTVSVSADTTNNALQIQGTGTAAENNINIGWLARIDYLEIGAIS